MQAVLQFPDLDPEIFAISVLGLEFALRWYALAYIAGIVIGWRLVVMLVNHAKLWPENRAPMTAAQVEQLLTWIILGVILGGRLGFVIFYKPGYYLSHPWEIPMLWHGGMAFHGGLLGVMLALIMFTRKHDIPLLSASDALAIAAPQGLLFGRLANFINAELWGRPSDVPWAMVFPGDLAQFCPGWDQVPCARHPSQLYEATLEGLVLGAVILWLVLRRDALKRPGFIAGVFFLGYGIGRIFVEFFRQADFQFVSPDNPMGYAVHWQGAGLTQGQLLSIPLIVLGLAFIATARFRRT
ncbi:Prolipoprotein diacylglyceryl transferase [Rhodovulum sp. P5]|uniref:prolipoprotein diacylglyceryl transferase n=1 Tax=Rhodovulum sp. P5 TaxID=1564506 RepID=UPI0009C23E3E|nr:prolipoprotein diacylglyceryl transferase [Rhodovulum sp. P5]ARE42170.1 Prolipoprotein diacylglyceryl transferase [Rhodovulum sp. P5]